MAIRATTSRKQREIVVAALEIAKKLAQDVASGARRLGLIEQPALDTIGRLAFVKGEFDKILPGDQGPADVELPRDAAGVLRTALGLWASAALRKDRDAKQLVLITDVSKVEKEAQELLDALSDQLSLPIENIATLDERAPKETPIEEDGKVQPAPHRGARKPHPGPVAEYRGPRLVKAAAKPKRAARKK